MARGTLAWIVAALAAVVLGWFAWQPQASGPAETKEKGMDDTNTKHCKLLTAEERRVIEDKGTERPFSGEYWNHHEDGTYTCKRCGAKLFPSKAKFDSGTGWPSFDDALPGAVKEVPDPDGMRIEIECASCGAHLGHVFRGEGFTKKQTRHCVNSLSLDFASTAAGNGATATTASAKATQEAFFAGGCFWGVEYWFEKEPGVSNAESGYMGGHKSSPSYEEVCDGDTGHIEAVRVVFDPSKTSYEKLARVFFEIHDPTQVDRQGPDVGEQYRSVVFYANEEQKRVTEQLIGELKERGFKVATRLEPAGKFWTAEKYHQDYYAKKGSTPYCHVRVKRF